MAISIYSTDFDKRNAGTNTDPLILNISVEGENRALVVFVHTSNLDPELLDVASVVSGELQFVQRMAQTFDEQRLETWTLWNPPAGAHQITITTVYPYTMQINAGVIALTGAQTDGYEDAKIIGTGLGNSPSVNITTVNDKSLILSALAGASASTSYGSQTLLGAIEGGTYHTTLAYYGPKTPPGSQTINFTNTSIPWILEAISIKPAPEPVSIEINGIDRSSYIPARSIQIVDEINSKINTCSFTTIDEDGAWTPSNGDEVEVYDHYSNKIFGGVISSLTEKRVGIVPGTDDELLQYTANCQDYTKILQRKLIIETYENKTCKEIIELILNKYFISESFTTTNTEDGPTLTQISFNYKTGEEALAALANAAGYQWFVDYDRDIHFFLQDDLTSQLTITDSTTNWTNLVITPDTTQLRNRIYIRGGIYYSDPYMQQIKADGTQEEFLLAYTPSYEGFSVSISGNNRTVGISNVDNRENFDFMLNRKEKTLSMGDTAWANANTPIGNGVILDVTYEYEIPVLTVQEDSDSISSMKTLVGGDGIYEYVIVDENITSVSAARERANAELRDYANAIVRGSVDSYDAAGLKSGDLITINSTRRGLSSDYIVHSIKISWISPTQPKYTINFSGRLYGLIDILIALFKKSQTIILDSDEVLDAFNSFTDFTPGSTHTVPVETVSAPPFKWSNDAGSTTNKMRWGLFEWS